MAVLNMNHELFNIKLQENEKQVLVEYSAPWCGYCRRIEPAYKKIGEQFAEELVVAKVDIDENPKLADQEQIEVIPTLVLYKNGEAVDSIVAPESKARIESFIRANLG